jgi:hypothetical protein
LDGRRALRRFFAGRRLGPVLGWRRWRLDPTLFSRALRIDKEQPSMFERSTRSRIVRTALVALAGLGLAGALAGMAPEPDPIPRRWELELEAGPLRAISLVTDDRGTPDASDDVFGNFLYLTYRVTNYTGRDLFFAPTFTLTNDSGEILRSGQGVSGDVTNRLLAALDQAFLESEFEALGVLHQGPENARDVLVIWPLNDLTIDEATVYAAGFSGEAKGFRVMDPATGEHRTETLR